MRGEILFDIQNPSFPVALRVTVLPRQIPKFFPVKFSLMVEIENSANDGNFFP